MVVVLACCLPRPVVSRLRGNDGSNAVMTVRGGCIVLFTLTLALSHQGRGDYVVGVVFFTRTSAAPLDCGSSPQ